MLLTISSTVSQRHTRCAIHGQTGGQTSRTHFHDYMPPLPALPAAWMGGTAHNVYFCLIRYPRMPLPLPARRTTSAVYATIACVPWLMPYCDATFSYSGSTRLPGLLPQMTGKRGHAAHAYTGCLVARTPWRAAGLNVVRDAHSPCHLCARGGQTPNLVNKRRRSLH